MFKLGVITDEVSQDFEQALRFAKRHNLDCVELRSAWEKGPFDFDDADIKKIKSLSDQYAIPVLAISSPLFKCGYFDEETKAELKSIVGIFVNVTCSRLKVCQHGK